MNKINWLTSVLAIPFLLLVAIIDVPAVALATETSQTVLPTAETTISSVTNTSGSTTHIGIALTAGLTGIGGELAVNINQFLGVRATVDGFSINRNGSYGTSATWDARLKLYQAGALLDVFPFAGTFRLSGGLVEDGNKFSLTGQPKSGSYTFNGNTYPSTDIASASATVDWNKSTPYFGLGWGNLAGSRGFHLTSDLGVLFTGTPKSAVEVTCSTQGNVDGICTQLASDVATEQSKLQKNVHEITFWPVVRFGIGYAF